MTACPGRPAPPPNPTPQTAFVLYTLFSTDKFNLDVQDMVDQDGVVDMEFR